jgi:aspartokinase
MDNFTTLLDVLSSDQLRPLFERIYNDTTEISDSEYIDDMTDHVSDVSSQSNNLTDQDQHNIDTLVSLGFQKNASIQAYLLCNKNVELAASMLMDN